MGELRASGHTQRSVREEIRENLLAALRAGTDPWPGLHGFSDTVLPQFERALLAGHDIVLLGEHPYDPITRWSRGRAAELGDAWTAK